MNLKEFFSTNNVTEIRNKWQSVEGYENLDNVIGKDVWICDYRINDPNNKPIRNVQPKMVRVFNNDDLPKNKNVYYSPIHFREIKGDRVLSTIIKPYDNTGFRAYTGVCLNIFENKDDCICYFNGQLKEAIGIIMRYKEKQNS